MNLIDANTLICLIDMKQSKSADYRAIFQTFPMPTITTQPVLAEAMYLLYRIGGWNYQRKLWEYIEKNILKIHFSSQIEQKRMYQLMEK